MLCAAKCFAIVFRVHAIICLVASLCLLRSSVKEPHIYFDADVIVLVSAFIIEKIYCNLPDTTTMLLTPDPIVSNQRVSILNYNIVAQLSSAQLNLTQLNSTQKKYYRE